MPFLLRIVHLVLLKLVSSSIISGHKITATAYDRKALSGRTETQQARFLYSRPSIATVLAGHPLAATAAAILSDSEAQIAVAASSRSRCISSKILTFIKYSTSPISQHILRTITYPIRSLAST